ncbi:unnamed protein product [Phyllotreta striolata]|uniref:Sushi, von Willebrand factor type A, EGF and pentraxin domain-containing protein 1 n=1 Tax=Phyllotreta striolata TaxID=444603 RepID=A0A9N9TKW9_PHYSR|nr:unnamed protein product [Phyllotreta striolata]
MEMKFALVVYSLGLIVVRTNAQGTKCNHPAVPLNSRVTLSTPEPQVGTVASYQCDEGYETFGDTKATCSPAGKWIGEPPFCDLLDSSRENQDLIDPFREDQDLLDPSKEVQAGQLGPIQRPANQSTTVKGGSALNANDGDKSTEHDGKRCSETQKETSPWWQVDLLKPYAVKAIRITTRGCCGHQPLQDLEVRVGNSSGDLQKNPLCAWFPGTIDEGVSKTLVCARVLVGQHVFLQLVGVEGSLSLCEVEVFSADEFSIDRCVPKNSPDETELATFRQTCYKFETAKGGSFADARTTCRNQYGDLVHSISPSDNIFIHSELDRRKSKMRTQFVWIGAQKEPSVVSRTWKWVDGELVQRPSWGKDQPNNYNGEQNCAVLDGGRQWLWNDVGCNLDYCHWICQHGPFSCGSPDKLANTTIINYNNDIGSTIEYRCPPGHMLVGDSTRKCGTNGLWTGSAPACKYVNCGPLEDIPHGTVEIRDGGTTWYGAEASYTCHENYTLIGREIRRCSGDGRWTEEAPRCLFDWCPEPPPIQGGGVSSSGRRAGDTATYRCHTGHITIGEQILSCRLGGEWSGKAPTCKYVDCGSPAHIDNGKYELLNGTTTVESLVEYSCIADYWMTGQKQQKCTREGKWSADAPSCELITCEEPEVPAGSYVVGYDFNVHSAIEYHCEVGHILLGDSTHTCNSNGEWSGTTPTCEFIDCGKVAELQNGETSYVNGTTYLNSEISYSCYKNFKLNGVSKRTCLDNKQWSDVAPKCEEIRCPEPTLAEHGILSVTGNDRLYGRTLIRTQESTNSGTSYKIGALLKYRCERGYKIVGEPLRTCEDDGRWSGNVPECVYVDCGTPEPIEHGNVMLPSNVTYYGVLALYACRENYELNGVSRRLCQENGTWSSDTPSCREIQCKEPEAPNGLIVTVNTYSVGGLVKYQCPRGHTMEGNDTRVCLKRGEWSGNPPLCIAVDCHQPEDIENGRVLAVNGTTYNSAIEYHCVPNFVRVGPYLRKCMESGEWSGETPTCKAFSEAPQDASNMTTHIGIGAGIVLFLLLLLGLIYLKLRKPVAVKNTENVEGAERKEDRSAAVMSYSTLTDRNGGCGNVYENINGGGDENVYDAPYEETGRRSSGEYEPEPVGRTNGVTINGVAVR